MKLVKCSPFIQMTEMRDFLFIAIDYDRFGNIEWVIRLQENMVLILVNFFLQYGADDHDKFSRIDTALEVYLDWRTTTQLLKEHFEVVRGILNNGQRMRVGTERGGRARTILLRLYVYENVKEENVA